MEETQEQKLNNIEKEKAKILKKGELFEKKLNNFANEAESFEQAVQVINSILEIYMGDKTPNTEEQEIIDRATDEFNNLPDEVKQIIETKKTKDLIAEIRKTQKDIQKRAKELREEREEIEQEKERIEQAEQEEEKQRKRQKEAIVINSDYTQFSNQKLSREILHRELKRNEKITIYKNNYTEVKDVIAMFRGEPHRLDNIDLLIAGYCSQIYKEFEKDSSGAKEARITATTITKDIFGTTITPNKKQIDEIIRRISNMQEMILVFDVSYSAQNYKSKYKGIDPNRLISKMFLPVDIDTLPVRNKKGEIIRTETNIYIKGQSPVYYHAGIIGQILTYEKELLKASIGGNGLTSMFIKLFILKNIERIKSPNQNMKPVILFDTFIKEMQADENKELTKKAKKNRIESACKFLDYLKEVEYIKDWSYKTNNKKENVGWNVSANKQKRKRALINPSKKVVSPDQQRAKKVITD